MCVFSQSIGSAGRFQISKVRKRNFRTPGYRTQVELTAKLSKYRAPSRALSRLKNHSKFNPANLILLRDCSGTETEPQTFSSRILGIRKYSPKPYPTKRPDWYYNRPPPGAFISSKLPGFVDSPKVVQSTSRQPSSFQVQFQKPSKPASVKRPTRPLSYVELVERQKTQELFYQKRQLAEQELQARLQTAFSSPPKPKSFVSSFCPKRGSRRFSRIFFQHWLGLDDQNYPFPETAAKIDGLRRKKKILFSTAHRFLLARFRDQNFKRALRAEKAPKKLNNLAKRTAMGLVKKEFVGEKQIEWDKNEVMNWKERDETFVCQVSSVDVESETDDTVTLKRFSTTRNSIRLAARLIQEGCVVAFPTETVYGLGANALSTSAVEKIYKAKNRPADNPLITHFGSIKQVQAFSEIPEIYLPLVETFWPGPLTILLPVKESMGISQLVTAGLDTVAVRIPSSPLARALLLEANVPIAAPSANASTRPSPTLADHVHADLNTRIPLILSADKDPEAQCEVGLESTVVDGLSDPPTILRLGGVSLESIRALGGPWRNTVIYKKTPAKVQHNGFSSEEDFKPRTPGMKYRHYSPRCPVYVYPFNSSQPEKPSDRLPPSHEQVRKIAVLCTHNWEPKEDSGASLEFHWLGDDAEEVARNLFKSVREMDEWGAEAIFVEGVEEVGIGRSVMERLRKMAGGIIEEKDL